VLTHGPLPGSGDNILGSAFNKVPREWISSTHSNIADLKQVNESAIDSNAEKIRVANPLLDVPTCYWLALENLHRRFFIPRMGDKAAATAAESHVLHVMKKLKILGFSQDPPFEILVLSTPPEFRQYLATEL
jgi:hypothetical protein